MLRAGGVHGSYEVGALKALVEVLDPIEYAYDYISGVSVGALNAGVMAKFEKGDEVRAVQEIYDMFTLNVFSDNLDRWPYIYINAFLKNSIYDVKRGYDFFERYIGKEPFKRKISYLSVNMVNT